MTLQVLCKLAVTVACCLVTCVVPVSCVVATYRLVDTQGLGITDTDAIIVSSALSPIAVSIEM